MKASTQMPVPLFRSPSVRLVQHDKLLSDDAYSRGSDGSIVCTLGINNKEEHHYTFQPSKQIVSIHNSSILMRFRQLYFKAGAYSTISHVMHLNMCVCV